TTRARVTSPRSSSTSSCRRDQSSSMSAGITGIEVIERQPGWLIIVTSPDDERSTGTHPDTLGWFARLNRCHHIQVRQLDHIDAVGIDERNPLAVWRDAAEVVELK